MKFITTTKKIQQGLNIVKNITGKNLNLPILNTVLMTAKNNQVNLSTTNLELGINYYLNTPVEDEGRVAIPSKIITDFVSNIRDEKIEISLKDNILSIQSNNFKTKLICFDPKDFPLIPKLKKESFMVLSARTFKNALGSVFD